MDEREWAMTIIGSFFTGLTAAVVTMWNRERKAYAALVKRVAILDNTLRLRERDITDLKVENATLRERLRYAGVSLGTGIEGDGL